jgi:predicted membrane-bound mannosyltransferase
MRNKLVDPPIQQWLSSTRDSFIHTLSYRPDLSRLRQRPHPGPEAWTYMILIVIALGMRLWDLGGRTLHYDELLHSWYAWRFSEGLGYSHTPLTHGPFLFHGAAASFALLGSSDVTVRLLPALFGTALVGLPYLLRKELGHYGALATSVLLAASPSILYFGRFIRNDIFMAVWALALAAIMWRYFETPRTRLLVFWTIVWALAFTTKESVFLLAATFGLFLFILSAPSLWQWVRGQAKLSDVPPAGDLLIVLGTLTLPLWAPVLAVIQEPVGIILANPDAANPRVIAGELARASAETGAPAGGGLFIAAFVVTTLAGISVTVGLLWDRRRWPLLMLLFVAIWLTFFTSVFTNSQGFFTGLWGSMGYWIAQQEVERAGQPWYYYILTMSTYEFLVAIAAVLGGGFLAVKGALFDRFLVGWALITFLLFTYAGEKMPWLLVGITLPTALVAGRTAGILIESALRTRFSPSMFVAGFGLMFLLPFVFLRVVRADSLASDRGIWVGVSASALVILVALVVGRRLVLDPAVAAAQGAKGLVPALRLRSALATAGLGSLALLLIATVLLGGRASYSYAEFERPAELLVYSQTGQETTYAADCIDRLAQKSGLGRKELRVLSSESDNFAWQWRWYLRDYFNVEYRFLNDSPLTEAPDVDVVILSRSVVEANRQFLHGFTEVGDLNHLWWFPNAVYLGVTPGSVISDAMSRQYWETLTDYLVTRNFDGAMDHSEGKIFVADQWAPLAEGCSALRAVTGP